MTRSTAHPWLLTLPLLLAICCCTQPIEEPEDAGPRNDDATDTTREDTADTTVDSDSGVNSEVATDPEIPESERFCDPGYAQPRLERGIMPEEWSPCSCPTARYDYTTTGLGNPCKELSCVEGKWWNEDHCTQDGGHAAMSPVSGFCFKWEPEKCIQDGGHPEGDPPPDATPDVDAEADTDVTVQPDAPPDSD